MLTILLGPPGCGKTALMLTRIGERAGRGAPSLLLTPESGSHQQERRLLETCGNRASAFARVRTFSTLTEDVLAAAGKNPRTLDAGGRVLTMYRALARCGDGLTYYRGASRPELLRRLLELAEELKAAAVPPERLLAAADSDRLRDLALIYTQYCALCAGGLMDPTDRLTAAMDALPETGLLRDTAVFIDDFDLLTGQKYAALAVLLRAAESVTFALPMGEDEQLYLEQRRTLSRLRRLAEGCGAPCVEETLPATAQVRPSGLEKLTAELFDYRAEPAESCEGVELYIAADPEEECELAAALLRQRALGGCRLRECAVVCGDLTEYGPLLERAFARYETPLFLSVKEDILLKPALQAALGGLQALEDGLPAESVLDWLKTGLCGLQAEELYRLENYVLQWNISGAKWRSPFTLPTCGYGNPEPDEADRLAAVERARQRVAALLEPLDRALRACRTGGDYAAALEAHLEQLGLEEGLTERTDRLRDLGLRRQAAEYAQLWDILTAALEQFAGAMAEEELDRTAFLRLLRLMLGQYDVSAIPVSLDSVQAVAPERMALGPLRHLIVVGGREGLLPVDKSPDSLLTESDRQLLETAGIELSQNAEERAFQQQLALVRVLAAPGESVTVTVPRRDGGGAECRMSYAALRIKTLLGLTPKDAGAALATLRLTAPGPLYALACAAAERGGSGPSAAALRKCAGRDGGYLNALRAYAAGPRGPIPDPALVRALYGGRLRLTASRLEQLSACRFAYFMQYGLKAKPRREARVGAPEAGTFVHYVVENAVRDLCQGTETDPQQAAARWAERYLRELPRTGARRQAAQLRAIGGLAADVVRNAWEEIGAGDFEPRCFELGFGMGEDGLPPLTIGTGDDTFEVRGQIDRLDLWQQGGTDYLKVVDYKTGHKSFRLSDVLEGVNLQLFLYLLALRRAPREELARRGIAAPAPAAALYLPARAPYAACPPDADEEERRRLLDKELRRIGLVVDDQKVLRAMERDGAYRFLPVRVKRDGGFTAESHVASPEELERLLRLTEAQAARAAALVRAGDVEAQPYEDGQRTACDWCDYKTACHFDPTMRKDRLRRLDHCPDGEVHERLRREEEGAER